MVNRLSKVKKALKTYSLELKRHNIRLTKAIVYGSYANGTPKSYSDMDVVIVSPDLSRFRPLERQELLAQLCSHVDAPLEVIGYTPAELKKSQDTIFGQIIRETGIPIKLS